MSIQLTKLAPILDLASHLVCQIALFHHSAELLSFYSKYPSPEEAKAVHECCAM